MSELQSTVEFSVELFKFYNVDLFQRGMYQVRCALRVTSKLNVEIEVTTPEVTTGLGTAIVLGSYGACRPFQILYRNEEVTLKDVVLFRCHILVDGNNLRESLERAEFSLILELWFSDISPVSMVMVSQRTLQLHMSPIEGLHYHLPILFDYFHLSAISLTVHATLTALNQPHIKKGLLRYMQSCAPKHSKSWSKIRTTQCSSLTDPVLSVNTNKIYCRINDSPQIHLEAYNVLVESNNNIKNTIKEYKTLLQQRDENITDCYDTLVVKHNEYDSTKLMKKRPYKEKSELAEVCAENIKLWNYFLLTFSCKIAIQQYLSKKHHNLRVRRFAELFFLIYNPRSSAFGCHDTNYQNYLVIADIARRSKYTQMLPPLPIHCIALDGESTTIPVIFEDQYQDPFEAKKKDCEKNTLNQIQGADIWRKPSEVDIDDTNWSCGIGKLWTNKIGSIKTLFTPDLYTMGDPLTFAIPTRHSKSLDHLQTCSTNDYHYFICNNRSNNKKDYNNKTKKSLKTVASDHNMRNRVYILNKEIDDRCSCCYSNYDIKLSPKHRKNDFSFADTYVVDKKYNQLEIKQVKQQYYALVKSFSEVPADITQNIFRSTSVQSFSPKNKLNNKFNSVVMKRSPKIITEAWFKPEPNQITRQYRKSHTNNKRTELSCILSSGEVTPQTDKYNLRYTNGIRRVKSVSCINDDVVKQPLSGTESLPNISSSKLEERLYNSEMKYYTSSSSSSSTSEQSGWITSRSSSLASSTDLMKPAPCPAMHFEPAQKKFFSNLEGKKSKEKKDKDEIKIRNKSNKFYIDSDSSNNDCKHISNDKHSIFLRGCEFNQNNVCEEYALPPPKQFRDLDSPSSSITNGINDEELNAVDNLLYHVIDTHHTNLEKRPSQFDLVKTVEREPDDCNITKAADKDSLKTFLKAKKEFKSQLKTFPGLLYSDMNVFASTIPYFHISDEFRIFSPEGMHLVVCVHGLDGNSADLRLVKTYLELGLPGAYLDFLMSERNQGDTFSDFDTMTDRLISEILHYLDKSSIRPTRISFVGHSLGNIIIRSALTRPQMKFLLPRLHTFLSLSGPHLGTLYNSSGLVNMGMWFMQKWKKSGSLLQLCLKDSVNPRQSFLYRLSQRSTLHHFKNILLCGSGQDRYVPLHSARIELCKESLKDASDQGTIFREMVHNIISPVIAKKEVKLIRYDIHHALPNTANALIGRAAHIAVLDSELFIEKFMVVVGIKYFR